MGRIALFNRAAVDELLDLQYGLITRRQATGCGMTESAMYHRIRHSGTWQVLLPGVYLAASGTPTGPQGEVAAQLYAGPASVITGRAALAAHGVRARETGTVDVLVPSERKRRDVRFVRVHRTSRMPGTVHRVGPIRYVPVARAVTDAARWLVDISDVRAVVAGAVQRDKVRIDDLAAELAAAPARGSALLREVLTEVTEGVRSAAEADLRTLIKREQLPDPLYNPRLFVREQFIAAPDAWWPDAGVAVEIDSREWHLSPRDWERTQARHSRMSAHGIIVLHYPPRRLRSEPRVVAAEIRSALDAGRNRMLPEIWTATVGSGEPR